MGKEYSLFDQDLGEPLMDFREARAHARSLGLKSREEWKEYVKQHGEDLPGKMPLNPEDAYRHLGWKGWNDWLGVKEPEKENHRKPSDKATTSGGPDLWEAAPANAYLPFPEARERAREQEFEYREEWEAYARGLFSSRPPLPAGIPPDPERVYRHSGWTGWTDWLVAPEKRKNYSSFHHAREFARSLRFKTQTEWSEAFSQVEGLAAGYGLLLPRKPDLEYAGKEWESWNDWLGTRIDYKSFFDTRRFVHSLNLESREEWQLYCQGLLVSHPRKPRNIFAYPEIAYRDEGWNGWEDWLGTGKRW